MKSDIFPVAHLTICLACCLQTATAAPVQTAHAQGITAAPTVPAERHVRLTAHQAALLSKQIESDDPDVRLNALNEVTLCGPSAAATAPAVISALAESRSFGSGAGKSALKSPRITEAAIKALAAIGPAAKDAGPTLLAILTDNTQLYRRGQVLNALNATGLEGSGTQTILTVLREEGKYTPTRLSAIQLLGKIEPAPLEAVDALKEISNDPTDKKASAAAQEAIKSITARAHTVDSQQQAQEAPEVSDLRPLLFAEQDKQVRLDALKKIADLEKKAIPLVPNLLQMLNETDPDIQNGAVDALASIGTPAAASTYTLVTRLFNAKTDAAREDLCRAISLVDPKGDRSIPLVKPMLDDPFKARTAIMLLDEIDTEQTSALANNAKRRWRIK